MRHQGPGPAIRDGLQASIRRRAGSKVAAGGCSRPLLKRVAGPGPFFEHALAPHPIPPGPLRSLCLAGSFPGASACQEAPMSESTPFLPPEPTEWHHMPEGEHRRCPICDVAATYVGRLSHRRATNADAATNARWFKRGKLNAGWHVTPIGTKSRQVRSKPREQTRRRIKKAVAIVVTGQPMTRAAESLGIGARLLYDIRSHYRDLWDRDYALAKEKFNAAVAKNIEDGWAQRLFALKQEAIEMEGKRRPECDRGRGELSAQMTLADFFWSYAWPDCMEPRGTSKRTQSDYLTSLGYWTRLTGNPPIREITKQTFSRFLTLLRNLPGVCPGQQLSANTIFKHWANIERLLEWTGPAGRHNRNGTGLVQDAPWVEAPRKDHPTPGPRFTLEEMSRWLAILPEAARPIPCMNGFSPAAWWRAVILASYNTGMRPGTLFAIRWEMIDGHSLSIPAGIIKGRHGRFLWLNDFALDALAPLRKESGPVFGWEDYPNKATTLLRERRELETAAGIRRLPLYGFRRAFATECGKINPMAMQIMMGHVGLGLKMAMEHYICAEDVLAEALPKMPQPEETAALPQPEETAA